MKFSEINIIKRVLEEELGLSWLPLLVKCQIKKGRIFKQTHWANETSIESAFAKRLSISTATYRELLKRFGRDKAFGIMRKILVPIGTEEQLGNLDKWGVLQKSGMEKLLAFYDATGRGGVGQFVQRTITEKNDKTLSFQVRNCFFNRFYEETGTPELTQLFCEVDIEFFSQAFPEFEFHRGDSLENTVAYGKDHCDFIFEKKS
jgi:hypothetical protein